MNHKDALLSAVTILNDRAAEYGPEELCFQRIASLATIVLNKYLNEYDIAMILHCVKLGRLQESRAKADNYIDGINYLSFAAQFAQTLNAAATAQHGVDALDDGIANIAQKYAPLPNINDQQ